MVSESSATLPDKRTTTTCTSAVIRRPMKDHLTAHMPRLEATKEGSTAPWEWSCPSCPLWACGCSALLEFLAIEPILSVEPAASRLMDSPSQLHRGSRCFYSPSYREGFLSVTGLPGYVKINKGFI